MFFSYFELFQIVRTTPEDPIIDYYWEKNNLFAFSSPQFLEVSRIAFGS